MTDAKKLHRSGTRFGNSIIALKDRQTFMLKQYFKLHIVASSILGPSKIQFYSCIVSNFYWSQSLYELKLFIMVVIQSGIALRIFPPKVFECWAGLAARQHKLRRKKRKMPSPRFELGTSGLPVRHADHYTMKSS